MLRVTGAAVGYICGPTLPCAFEPVFFLPALRSPCSKFDCSCVCNRRAQACDVNCCCDPECSAVEVARFRALGTCVAEGPVNRSVVSCVSLDQARAIAQVNQRPQYVNDAE